MHLRSGSAALVLAAALLAHGDARARGRHPRPPPEAIAACRDRAPGDTCTVAPPDGRPAIDGTCRAGPGGEHALACVPDGPPPEAIDACHGRAAGDACVVERGGGQVEGTCRPGPDGKGPLACAPARRGPPPR